MGELGGLTEVDFEIALTAFFVSTVSVFPSPALPEFPAIQLFAIGLLVLTLIRRLAIINELDKNSRFLEGTTHLLHLFTYISLLYLFYIAAQRFAGMQLVSLSTLPVFFILVPMGVFTILLVQESLLKDSLSGSEQLFSGVSDKHRGSVFGGLFSALAVSLGKKRQAFHKQTRQSNLGEFYERDVAEMSQGEIHNRAMSTLKAMASVILVILFYTVLFVSGSVVFNVRWYTALFLLITLLVVTGLVDMWYSNYGVLGVSDRNGYLQGFVMVLTYLFAARMVFY